MLENPIYACLSFFFNWFFLHLTSTEWLKWKKSGERAVVITSPVAFVIKESLDVCSAKQLFGQVLLPEMWGPLNLNPPLFSLIHHFLKNIIMMSYSTLLSRAQILNTQCLFCAFIIDIFLCCCALSLLSLFRHAVSSETPDGTWSFLWRAKCVEPKVLCGCWLSDAASEWRGGGESRLYSPVSCLSSFCVAIVFLLLPFFPLFTNLFSYINLSPHRFIASPNLQVFLECSGKPNILSETWSNTFKFIFVQGL